MPAAPTPAPRPTRVPPPALPRAPRIPRLPPRSTLRHSTSSVDNGPKADDDAIAASTWATAVKDAGVFKIGGVQTSTLFSLLNEKDGQTRGFDAGIAQLLSNYILGENKVEITQVTSDTRESVLQNGQVDAVFATYTITDERKKLVSFAGPYYYTQQAILVLADNDDIKSVDDLADKNVAVQSGSNGPAILEEFAPKASQQEFKTDEEARQALQQGRVDAYVIDNNMQQSALVREPGKYKIAGKPFGSKEPYGIGLPLDSDGVAFVNDFLKKIEDDGTWTSCGRSASATVRATPMFPSCPRSAPRQQAW